MDTQPFTHAHTHTRLRTLTNTRNHTHKLLTHLLTNTLTHTHPHSLSHTHKHTTHLHTHIHSHSHSHSHTHSPVDILHVNSAVVNGCMWLHVFWLTVAVVVGDPLVCSPGEHVRPLQEHEALLVLHTAVVDFKHRCGAGVLMGMMSQLHHISF